MSGQSVFRCNVVSRILGISALAAALIAFGCGSNYGGGGGGGGSTVSGVFNDALVQGLSYTCGTTTGVTGAGGTFTCPAQGGNVTFSVGGITVCTAPAQPVMTPLSCAQATNASANASTASVIAVVQFLLSISTTPASSGTLTITPAEITAAANQTLNFSTATQTQLLQAVQVVTNNNSATLVSMSAAQTELTTTVLGALAGTYSGTYSGSHMGTFSVTISSSGTVSGSGNDSVSGAFAVAGSLTTGTTYSGTSGTATWTGTLDTSKSPVVFSGTWSAGGMATGTFTGTKQ